MDSLKRLLSFFKAKQKIQFVVLFIIQFIGSLLELVGVSMLLPFVQALLMPDELMQNKYIQAILKFFGKTTEQDMMILLLCGLIIIYIVKNIYMVFMLYVQYQIIWHNRVRMEYEVFEFYLHKPYMYHVEKNSGEVQRIILSDIGGVFEVLSNVFLLVSELLTSFMLVILLIRTDFVMTSSIVVIMILFLLLFFKFFKKRLNAYGRIAQKYSALGNSSIVQAIRGIKEIKIYECEHFFTEEFRKSRTIQCSMIKRGIFFQQVPKYFLEMCCTAGVLGIVLIKVLAGTQISELIGPLTVFAMAAYRMLPSVNRINTELAFIENNKAAIDVVYGVMHDNLSMEELIDKKLKMCSPADTTVNIAKNKMKDISLEKVSYHYPTNDKMILKNTSLTIRGGSSIAFKGPSGAGKTTTADLILGILTPTEGKITYDGTEITKLKEGWFPHLGYIPQNIYLSDDTVRKNVAFGVENPDDEKVWKALEKAQLKDFILSSPNGLDSIVGEAGVRISGGQRQRIGIARALYNDPEILVLDEATSALDTETEEAVMEAINQFAGQKTLIIIAHRLSTIEKCDEVYTVCDGKITKDVK